MPIYEYQCLKCGKRSERLQNLSAAPLTVCEEPECGGDLKKLISAPAVQFKGSGWYVTDYGGKGKKAEGSSEGKSDGKSEGKSESKSDVKSDGKSESKSESKGDGSAGSSGSSESSTPAASKPAESKPAAKSGD
ncbi:MAG TPA: FmdB family zinc ribbon protein [Thermoanaerobaculia bacterium]|nr:FmdB family zinc ribbon protein [Thermoanaerobaculia bacterium]